MHPPHRAPVALAIIAIWLAVATLVVPSAGATPAAPGNEISDVAVPVVHIEGRGHGHGVGMSQWGAYTLANAGASANDIIATFYPGTALATVGGTVVVGIQDGPRTLVSFPAGGQIRSTPGDGPQAAGFPVQVAPGQVVEVARTPAGVEVRGGTVTPLGAGSVTRFTPAPRQDCLLVCPDGGAPANGGDCILCLTPPPTTTTTTAPPTTAPPAAPPSTGTTPGSTAPSGPGGAPDPAAAAPDGQDPAVGGAPAASGPVWAVPAGGSTVTAVDRGRTYRGSLEIAPSSAGVRVRNHVDIEDYLKGMAEVPGSWPAAAVQAQAIAARTYALRAMEGAGELCDTESCQVYVGTARESAGQIAAVDATRNVVVTADGGLAATFYSASAGGISATAAEGFGSSADISYLQRVEHPDANPQPYAVDVALTDVAARFGYPGTITDIRIDTVGPSGRATQMSIAGTAGVAAVDPQDFRRRLGLRSTLFTVAMDETTTAPAPPPEASDDSAVDVVGDGVDTADTGLATLVRSGAVTGLPVADGFRIVPTPRGADGGPAFGIGAVVFAFGLLTVARMRRLAAAPATAFLGGPTAMASTPMSRRPRRVVTMAPWRRPRP